MTVLQKDVLGALFLFLFFSGLTSYIYRNQIYFLASKKYIKNLQDSIFFHETNQTKNDVLKKQPLLKKNELFKNFNNSFYGSKMLFAKTAKNKQS